MNVKISSYKVAIFPRSAVRRLRQCGGFSASFLICLLCSVITEQHMQFLGSPCNAFGMHAH